MLHGHDACRAGQLTVDGPSVATPKAHERAGGQANHRPVTGPWLGPAGHLSHAGTPL